MEHHEIIIVGTTMGGSVCAWELVRNGYDVLIIDEKLMSDDTLCAGYADDRFWKALELKPEEYPNVILEADLILDLAPKLNYAWTIPGFIKKLNFGQVYSLYKMDLTNFLLQRANAKYINLESENREKIDKIERRNGLYIINNAYSCQYLVGAGEPHSCPVRKTFFSYERKAPLIRAVGTDISAISRKAAMRIFPFFMKGIYLGYTITKPRGIMNVGLLAYEKKIDQYQINYGECLGNFLELLKNMGMIDYHALDKFHCIEEASFYVRRNTPIKSDRCYLAGEAADPASKDLKERNLASIESGLLAAKDIMGTGTFDATKLRNYSIQVFENMCKIYRVFREVLFRHNR